MADQSSNKDQIVEFGGFEVVYVSGERGQPIPEQAPTAFDALEARLPTLRKKRFYGAVIDGAYRAPREVNFWFGRLAFHEAGRHTKFLHLAENLALAWVIIGFTSSETPKSKICTNRRRPHAA